MKKIFIEESSYEKVKAFFVKEKIVWDNGQKFQFDIRTAIVIFIATAILAVILL